MLLLLGGRGAAPCGFQALTPRMLPLLTIAGKVASRARTLVAGSIISSIAYFLLIMVRTRTSACFTAHL